LSGPYHDLVFHSPKGVQARRIIRHRQKFLTKEEVDDFSSIEIGVRTSRSNPSCGSDRSVCGNEREVEANSKGEFQHRNARSEPAPQRMHILKERLHFHWVVIHARQGWLVRDNRDNGLGIGRRYIECDHRAAAVAKHECRGFTDGLQYGDSVSTLLGNVEMIRMVHRTAATRPTVVDNDFEVCRE